MSAARDPVFAMLVRENTAVRMRRGTWSEEFPVEKLEERLAMYVSMTKRAGGQHAKHHQPNVDALLKVKAKLEEVRREG